jgi:two-component system NtrC family sensor kinase
LRKFGRWDILRRGIVSRLLHHVTESLTAKLVVVLGLLILLGSGVFWYISIRTEKKNLMDNTVAFVSSFSETVKRSVRHDMLRFERDDIQRILESIGGSESIEKVSIFDSKGIIFYSSEKGEVGQSVVRASPACIGCHTDPMRPSETMLTDKRWTIYRKPGGGRVLSFVEPIYNEPDCYSAACHAHSEKQKVLGILTTDFSLHTIDMRIKRQMMDTSFYIAAFFAVSAVLLYLVLWRFVLKPVTTLSRGMEEVSSGDLSHKMPVASSDEIGSLACTFNTMTEELSAARQKMQRWTESLEEEVEKKGEEIRKAQDKLVQAEKLAALGRLTADVAHEIRNPLTALGGFGRRLLRMAANEKEKEYADIVVSEVERLEHILRDVLTFSRDAKFHLERQPVTDAVKEAISLLSEACEERSIRVETDFGTELPVLIDREQVRQAVSNLMVNAMDAMQGGGTLTVSTGAEEANSLTYVAIHVSDTGTGIPEEKLPLIFEPFYTTKEIGHGTGLGLSISRKIIEEHGGFIRALNRAEGGVTVSLYFPYQGEEELARIPCWEYMKCGRDVNSEVKCPAYPNFGRVCWVVAGTFCEGKVQGTFAQKYEDCRKCDFYRRVVKREI